MDVCEFTGFEEKQIVNGGSGLVLRTQECRTRISLLQIAIRPKEKSLIRIVELTAYVSVHLFHLPFVNVNTYERHNCGLGNPRELSRHLKTSVIAKRTAGHTVV